MDRWGANWKGVPAQLRRDRRLGVGALAVAFVVVAATIWTVLPKDGPGGAPRVSATPVAEAPASPDVAATAAADSTPDASDAWNALAIEPYRPVAELTAAESGRAGVAAGTSFTLVSLAGEEPEVLAARLEVAPPVDLAAQPGPVAGSVVLRPARPLAAGALYRFELASPTGTPAASWAFQVAAPLHVVTTVPYDQATDVPLRTGIELTFNQDGALDPSSHFSIEPATEGRFEQHDRTLVFVPDALEPATLYTVTLTRGIRLAGSDQLLEDDVVIRFETAATGQDPAAPTLVYGFGRPVIELPVGERPVVALSIEAWGPDLGDDEREKLRSRPFDVAVHRLGSEQAGLDAIRAIMRTPEWTRWSGSPVATDDLADVGTFTVAPAVVGEDWGPRWFRLPVTLDAGWYLVEAMGSSRPVQVVLQVTNVAGYVAAATDRMLVWANDIDTGEPLAGAGVQLVGGPSLGSTDADGLLVADTPEALLPAAAAGLAPGDLPVLAIRTADGRTLLMAAGSSSCCGGYRLDRWSSNDPVEPRDHWWLFLATDRNTFRPTDTINVWGFVRDRDTGRVPADLELRLSASGASDDAPPVVVAEVEPDLTGAFATSLQVRELPYGGYTLELWTDGEQLASTWVDVAVIRKPAYELELELDRHVVVAGDSVRLTATATFFDGTAVPGVRLGADFFGERTITADRDGRATATAVAIASNVVDEDWQGVSIHPTLGEEGDIGGWSELIVFPADVRLEGEGSVADGRLVVTGSLHKVAVERLEDAWQTDAWGDVDWNAAPVAGARVTAAIVEHVPVRTHKRTSYDFISKQVIDTWEYRIDEVARGTRTVSTAADGTLRLSIPVTDGHDYVVTLSAVDARGRTTRTRVYATAPRVDASASIPRLEQACGEADYELAIGDPLCVAARDEVGPISADDGGRFLFFDAQRGLREVTVTTQPEVRRTFTAADVPDLEVTGVWFTGSSLVPLGTRQFRLDTAERELTVELSADRERYAPRQTVTLGVRTLDAGGRPVVASVVVRGVDQKLYAMGHADDPDVLGDLYAPVGSWIVWTQGSHPVPDQDGGGYGDTTGGGGGRADFRDFILFRRVTTDTDGRAQVSFTLSDDLTSWHVSAAAMTAVPEVGHTSLLVPVGLPFFVEATVAPEYLVGDRAVLRLRAFGSALKEGDPVTFTVSSTSLAMPATTVRGVAFEDATVTLPPLSAGEHAVVISGSGGSAALSDTLTRRFTVVASRLLQDHATYSVMADGMSLDGGPGLTTYLFTDAGRGRYLDALHGLVASGGPRLDQALAAAIARDILVSTFGVERASLPAAAFDPSPYQRDGLALLPYSSRDPALTARVALLAPDWFDREYLGWTLQEIAASDDTTRELQVQAYAGLAGLGWPVLPRLQAAAAQPDLSVRERLYAALGLVALGDEASARSIERSLLAAQGQRRGAWIRLEVAGSPDATAEATGLLALLAASLGDPVADGAHAYVDANPAVDELHSLQDAAFIARMLERTASAPARFAYSIDGRRTVVDLGAGESYSVGLLPSQRSTAQVELLGGSVGVAATWAVPLDASAVVRDTALELVRTATPSPAIPADALVEVRLTATFGPDAVAGCHEVADLVPSGLAPMESRQAWPDDEAETPGFVSPYRIDGQRVSFCVGPSEQSRTVRMRYFARIVTAGTYEWEPAVIQAASAPESINLTSATRVTIGP